MLPDVVFFTFLASAHLDRGTDSISEAGVPTMTDSVTSTNKETIRIMYDCQWEPTA
jgi:hypothetical protein